MKRDSKLSELFRVLVTAVLIIVGVKLFWSIVSLYLPIEGVDAEPVSHNGKLYYRYRLATDAKPQIELNHTPLKKAPTIRDLKLLAVYRDAGNMIAVVEKRGKSHVLLKGDTIDGFKLVSVDENSAEFVRNKKSYILKIKDLKLKNNAYETLKVHKKIFKNIEKSRKIPDEPSVLPINRANINKYIKNMDKIWKDISIVDFKKDGKLAGFKVRYIRRGSFFQKIGLKRGDLIVEINGEEIEDYSLPMKKLREIETLDNLSLTVIRNGERKELEYEIE